MSRTCAICGGNLPADYPNNGKVCRKPECQAQARADSLRRWRKDNPNRMRDLRHNDSLRTRHSARTGQAKYHNRPKAVIIHDLKSEVTWSISKAEFYEFQGAYLTTPGLEIKFREAEK
jgi:hypothetical protein